MRLAPRAARVETATGEAIYIWKELKKNRTRSAIPIGEISSVPGTPLFSRATPPQLQYHTLAVLEPGKFV